MPDPPKPPGSDGGNAEAAAASPPAASADAPTVTGAPPGDAAAGQVTEKGGDAVTPKDAATKGAADSEKGTGAEEKQEGGEATAKTAEEGGGGDDGEERVQLLEASIAMLVKAEAHKRAHVEGLVLHAFEHSGFARMARLPHAEAEAVVKRDSAKLGFFHAWAEAEEKGTAAGDDAEEAATPQMAAVATPLTQTPAPTPAAPSSPAPSAAAPTPETPKPAETPKPEAEAPDGESRTPPTPAVPAADGDAASAAATPVEAAPTPEPTPKPAPAAPETEAERVQPAAAAYVVEPWAEEAADGLALLYACVESYVDTVGADGVAASLEAAEKQAEERARSLAAAAAARVAAVAAAVAVATAETPEPVTEDELTAYSTAVIAAAVVSVYGHVSFLAEKAVFHRVIAEEKRLLEEGRAALHAEVATMKEQQAKTEAALRHLDTEVTQTADATFKKLAAERALLEAEQAKTEAGRAQLTQEQATLHQTMQHTAEIRRMEEEAWHAVWDERKKHEREAAGLHDEVRLLRMAHEDMARRAAEGRRGLLFERDEMARRHLDGEINRLEAEIRRKDQENAEEAKALALGRHVRNPEHRRPEGAGPTAVGPPEPGGRTADEHAGHVATMAARLVSIEEDTLHIVRGLSSDGATLPPLPDRAEDLSGYPAWMRTSLAAGVGGGGGTPKARPSTLSVGDPFSPSPSSSPQQQQRPRFGGYHRWNTRGERLASPRGATSPRGVSSASAARRRLAGAELGVAGGQRDVHTLKAHIRAMSRSVEAGYPSPPATTFRR